MTDLALNSAFRATAPSMAADPERVERPQSLIRPAHPEDLAQLTDLLANSFYDRTGWMYWVYPVIKFGIQEDLKQRIKTEKSNYACLTALVSAIGPSPETEATAKSIAGTAEVAQRQSWPWQELSAKYAYISNLAVAQPFRRRGLAGQLLAACEALALAWDLKDLYLHVMEDNLAACQLYRRAGFQLFQAEETTATWLGLQPRRLLLHKPLTQTQAASAHR